MRSENRKLKKVIKTLGIILMATLLLLVSLYHTRFDDGYSKGYDDALKYNTTTYDLISEWCYTGEAYGDICSER